MEILDHSSTLPAPPPLDTLNLPPALLDFLLHYSEGRERWAGLAVIGGGNKRAVDLFYSLLAHQGQNDIKISIADLNPPYRLMNPLDKNIGNHPQTPNNLDDWYALSNRPLITQAVPNAESDYSQLIQAFSRANDPDIIAVGSLVAPDVFSLTISFCLSGYRILARTPASTPVETILALRKNDPSFHLATILNFLLFLPPEPTGKPQLFIPPKDFYSVLKNGTDDEVREAVRAHSKT